MRRGPPRLGRRRRGVGPRPAPPGRFIEPLVAPLPRLDAPRTPRWEFAATGRGVASYVAAGADTAGVTSAEFALVVVHDVPAQGVGTRLLRPPALLADERGTGHISAAMRHDGTVVQLERPEPRGVGVDSRGERGEARRPPV